MKMFVSFVFIVFFLLLTPTAQANNAHDNFMAMDEGERMASWGAHLRASGEACPVVTSTFFQGFDRQAAIWSVQCNNGRAFAVLIEADKTGSTKILDCELMKMLGSSCFKKF